MDLDVIIKGKELMLDVNQLFLDGPKLSVWRVTVAYRGEPLLRFGRGVKGDIKIHPIRMARFLTYIWLEKRRLGKRIRLENPE